MRRISYIALLMALAVSCVKPDFEFNPESIHTSAGGTVTSANDKTISVLFTEAAGNATVEINATSDWTAEMVNTRAESWCQVSPVSGGKGINKLTVNVSANDGFSDRKAMVRISCGDVTRNIDVTQKQKNSLTLTSDRFEIPADGGNAEVVVKTNVNFSWEIEEAAKGWVKFLNTKELREQTLVFNVAANDDIDKREATITITGEGQTETVKIYQEGSKPSIVISDNEYAVSDEGGQFSVEVNSNVNVACSIPSGCTWLKEVKTKGMSTCTFVLEAEPNPEYEARYAEVIFINTENNLSEKIYVTQVQKDAIVVACDRYDVSFRGGNIELSIGHNVDYLYEIGVDWIKLATTKSYTTDKLVFAVNENKSDNPREGIISFRSKDGKLSQDVKVCQAQADKIIISDLEKSVSDKGGNFDIEIKSNIEYSYRIVQEGDWLHDVSTKASTSRTLQFRADPNEAYEPREAQIIVTSNDGSFTGNVSVIQMQKDALVVANTRYDLSQDGGEISIKIGHNVDFTTSINCDWISSTKTKAFTEEVLKFNVAANPSPDSREGAIVFTSKDGSITQTVKVCQAQKDQLVVGDTEKIVSDEGGKVDIEVKANVDYSFRIASGSEWLHAVTTRALTSKTLSFTADPNTTYNYREAQVVITSNDGKLKASVLVGQVQNDAIVISLDRIDVDNTGDEFSVKVGHNVDYTLTINGDWIKQKSTKAYTEETLRFTVAENTGDDSREGSLTFKSKDGRITQTVKVVQSAIGRIILSESEKAISNEESTFQVEIKANVEYSYRIEQSGGWLSEVNTKGMSSKTLTFKASANTGYEPRKARIIVAALDGKASNTLTVTQMQKDALVIATDRYDIPNTGGEITVKLGHNVDFTTSIDVDWIKQTTTKAYTEKSIKFTVAKNTGDDSRTGYITFTSKDGKLTQKVKVIQAQLDQLIINGDKEIVVEAGGGKVDIEIAANVAYNYQIKGGTWLHAVTKGLQTKTLTLIADANTSKEYRSVQVVVTSTSDASLSQTVTVSQVQNDALVVSADRYDVSSAGGTVEIPVGHNVDYDITISDSWVTKAGTKAYTTDKLVFNVAKNTGDDSRMATITFTSKDKKLTQTVKVVQAQLDQLIINGDKEIVVEAGGGKVDIEIAANVAYNYQIKGGTWLHAATKGLQAKTLTLIADANTSNEYRDVQVIVTSTSDASLSQTVTVGQVQNDALVVASNRYEVGTSGGTVTIPVGHNVDYDIDIDVNWISKASTKAYTTDNLVFNVAQWNGDEPRTGYITFTSKDKKLSQTVKVVQSQLNQLILTQKEFNLASSQGQIEVEVKSNVNYSYKIATGVSWIHEVTTKALSTKTIAFSIDANTSYDSRSATITFTSSDGKLKETVTVNQFQKNGLIAESNAYSITNDGGQLDVKISSNVSFQTEVTEGKEWISVVTTKGLTTSTISFNIAKNTTGAARQGKVKFLVPDTQLSQEIVITQDSHSVLVITHNAKKNVAYKIPSISGSNLTGTIDWGDGSSSAYAAGATHTYTKDGSFTTTITTGEATGFSGSVSDITEINLSKF